MLTKLESDSDQAVLTLRGWHLPTFLTPWISLWDLSSWSTKDQTTLISGRLPAGNVLILCYTRAFPKNKTLSHISALISCLGYQVSYDPRSYKHNLCNCVYRGLKNSGLQRNSINCLLSHPQFNVWNMSYLTSTFIPHRLVWTHKWPAPNVSGFITQLVRVPHGYCEVTGSNPDWSLDFLHSWFW